MRGPDFQLLPPFCTAFSPHVWFQVPQTSFLLRLRQSKNCELCEFKRSTKMREWQFVKISSVQMPVAAVTNVALTPAVYVKQVRTYDHSGESLCHPSQ